MVQAGVSPIQRIQVSDGEFSRVAMLRREEIGAEALGYIVPNRVTQMGVMGAIDRGERVEWLGATQVVDVHYDADGVRVAIAPSSLAEDSNPSTQPSRWLRAKLLVAADGARSRLRERAAIPLSRWGYSQACIVTTVTTELSHDQTAFERFQPSGPFAILPMHSLAGAGPSHRSCVVWTIQEGDREHLMGLDDARFIEAISPWFGAQLGRITEVTARACYVPQRLHCRRYVDERFALVGDAAHSTHPVGGQGVNLGMRDVAVLAQVLGEAAAAGEDVGSLAVLRRYERWRWGDNGAVLWVTDVANRMFSNRIWPLQWLRRLGLVALPLVPWLKKWLMVRAMGLGGRRARLIEGEALGVERAERLVSS